MTTNTPSEQSDEIVEMFRKHSLGHPGTAQEETNSINTAILPFQAKCKGVLVNTILLTEKI